MAMEGEPLNSTMILANLDIDENTLFDACLYNTSASHSLLVGFSDQELKCWAEAYSSDEFFCNIISALKGPKPTVGTGHPQYFCGENGLLYFEDWNGNNRLCVPSTLRQQVMSDVHNSVMESAHGGYHRCYNRPAATHYWPHMS
jgi:hypothetical protein